MAANATSFNFATAIASGATYAVTVKTQPSGQSCTVSNGTGTVAISNVTSVTLACATNAPPTYTVGGTISGLTGTGLVLQDTGTHDLSLGAAATSFIFGENLPTSATYSITVRTQPAGQTCSVANYSGTIASSNISNVAIACKSYYTLGGTVSNLKGAALILLLQDKAGNASNASVLPGQSTFGFGINLLDGTGYTVTVQQQPYGQSCTVTNGSGTVSGSNVGSVVVGCATVAQWAWISGDDTSRNAVYGTQGKPDPGNTPGGRSQSVTSVDVAGNLWLFGGAYHDGSLKNDLWMYNPSAGQWTWVGGSSSSNVGGVYGTQGVAASGNVPGARYGAVSWTDTTGNFWLFGGQGYDSAGVQGWLNDLWEYNSSIAQWTWISGSSLGNASGVYGSPGVEAAANQPGGRLSVMGWIDSANNLWLFGGAAFDASGLQTTLNDLWKFDVGAGQWTWFCSSPCTTSGVYGKEGVPDAANAPGVRQAGVTWTDGAGQFWLFGGNGKDSAGTSDALNDLWRYSPASGFWTWMGGSKIVDALGIYGVKGVASTANAPGARYHATGWIDLSGSFWLFGGEGYDSITPYSNIQNDVWKYDPASGQWTWIDGANADGGGDPGLYQAQGLSGASVLPGARSEAMSWMDASGVWLYGGAAASPALPGATSYTIESTGGNDLWFFGPALLYNGTGSLTGTFTDQNGCQYTANAVVSNANVTLSTKTTGGVSITFSVPTFTPLSSNAATCGGYGSYTSSFEVPISVNGSSVSQLPGSTGTLSGTLSGGAINATVSSVITGIQGSGTFTLTESGSFSTPAATVPVPTLIGLNQAAAASAIAAAGLEISTITEQSSSTVLAGDVISQTPAAASTVATGTSVALIVSTGPAPGTPVALATAPNAVLEYATVSLNGANSTDTNSTIQTYLWKQTSGPTVHLNGGTASVATFTAPHVSGSTPVSFLLTVTDTLGTTSSAGVALTVIPATPEQLSVSVVSAELLQPDSTSAHSQFDRIQGAPLAGASLLLEVALSGAVQTPTFTLSDINGNVLSTPTLSLLGSSSNQPIVFAGQITVPSVPFTVAASGNTGDGQKFNVSSDAFGPMQLTASFVPSEVPLVPGAAGSSALTIYNAGGAATVTITVNDPSGLLAQPPSTTLQMSAQSSATVPVAVLYPAFLSVIGPTLTATVSVTGDSTRNAIATLTLWDRPQ